MKHKISKVKIRGGKDANDMLMRKLSYNFLKHGHLTTTHAKAKVLKSFLDRVLNKMTVDTQANKSIVFGVIRDEKMYKDLYSRMNEEMKNINGSFLKMEKVKIRTSDSAPMVKVSWAHEFLKPEVKEEPKAKKAKAEKPARVAKPKAEKAAAKS